MDRFIDDAKKEYYTVTTKFKIQYGQIYSTKKKSFTVKEQKFKIQYGQIYRVFSSVKTIDFFFI